MLNIKPIVCVLLICISHLTVSGQTVEWSNPQKIKNKTLHTQILGEGLSGIFLLRCRDMNFETNLVIEKYKSNLSLEISQDLPISINGLVERVLLIENFIYVFITAKNNSTGNIDVLVQKIDESLKPVGLPIIMGSIPAENYIDKKHIQIKTSSNKNYITLMFLTKIENTGILNLWTYDKSIKQYFAKQFNLGRNFKDIFVTNYEVSNYGQVFVLIDFPKTGSDRKKSDPREFFIYGYYPNADKMLEYAINNDNFFVEDLSVAINNYNQTANIFGTYAKPGEKGITGYFFYRINYLSGMIENKFIEQIDYATFFKNYFGKTGDKQYDLDDFYIRKIIPRSDGGIIALIEKYYQTRQVYTYFVGNFPQTTTRTLYHYDEVSVININADGTLKEVNWVKKNQTSVNDGSNLLSFAAVTTTDNVYFLYNLENGSDNDVMLTSYSFNGEYNTRILLKNSNSTILIIPGEFKQISSRAILITAIKDKRFALLKITF